MSRLSKARVALLVLAVAAVLAIVAGVAVWAALGDRERQRAPLPVPVPTFDQTVPDEGLPPETTEPPGAGADASAYGDASDVPGAFQVGDYWFIDCADEHAANPPEFPQHGCQIAGFEVQLPTLIADDELARQQPASADEQATALAFVAAWVAYDSTADRSGRDAQLARLAPAADLPDVPELGWASNQAAYGDLGYRAEVRLRGEPRVTTSLTSGDGASQVTVEADYLGIYTAAVDCPWDELGAPDDSCALGHVQGPSLWTVHLQDGQVTAIFEPDVLAG